jgi:hypothetical protein
MQDSHPCSGSTVPLKHPHQQAWTYASLTVLDGKRQLKPAQLAFDRIYFVTPPRLTSAEIEIIVTNGDAEQRHRAVVLPHDADATRIPIQLLPMSS